MSTLKSKLMAAGLAGLAVAGVAGQAQAQNRAPTVLVMTEDADPKAVARSNRMMKRVYDAMMDELMSKGYSVMHENRLTMDFTTKPGERRTERELLQIARLVKQPPIDIVVSYEIYAVVEQVPYTNKDPVYRANVSISGRAIAVASGRFLGAFDVGPQDIGPLAKSCIGQDHCLLESVGAETRVMGRDLAHAIGNKVAIGMGDGGRVPPVGGPIPGVVGQPMPGPGPVGPGPVAGLPPVGMPGPGPMGQPGCAGFVADFSISIEGFTATELTAMEEYLASFSCFISKRVVPPSGPSRTNFWYTTQSDEARLFRNLRLMLSQMNLLERQDKIDHAIIERIGDNKIRVRKLK
ncbi:MAG TPA: hypothetical protein PK264_22970 [Hyphomicrobiaceae bacterium]|nr:hypothetical protein [Hyphomicrobiaceae bacterium]